MQRSFGFHRHHRGLSARSHSPLMLHKFARFAAVGGVATILQYLILVLLVEIVHLDAVLASAFGFAASSVLNYRLNYSFTFSSNLSHRSAFPKFLATAFGGLLLNTVTIYVLINVLGFYYLAGQLLATAVTLIWNFAINTVWTFRIRNKGCVRDQ